MHLTDQITQLADANTQIAALWLYGSRARGDHHSGSDHDLAVAFIDWEEDPLERRLRPELLAQQWLQSLDLPDNTLSLVDIAIAPIPLGIAILADGKLLLDKEPGIRLQQESRILSRWEIDYEYHQQQYG